MHQGVGVFGKELYRESDDIVIVVFYRLPVGPVGAKPFFLGIPDRIGKLILADDGVGATEFVGFEQCLAFFKQFVPVCRRELR